jgi:hypothetical protein
LFLRKENGYLTAKKETDAASRLKYLMKSSCPRTAT